MSSPSRPASQPFTTSEKRRSRSRSRTVRSWSRVPGTGRSLNASGIIGSVSRRQAFHRASYAAGSSSSTRWPMHQVITRPAPSQLCRPVARTPSTRARSRATDGFSAITSCIGLPVYWLSARGGARCVRCAVTAKEPGRDRDRRADPFRRGLETAVASTRHSRATAPRCFRCVRRRPPTGSARAPLPDAAYRER